jgi:hypothetical protein
MTASMLTNPGFTRFSGVAGLIVVTFFLAACAPWLAAQPNPFADDDPNNPAPRPSSLLANQPKQETNPAVLSILDSKPQTVLEMTRASQQLVHLNRPALAVLLLERIAAAGADDDELADLITELDSTFFLRITHDTKLQPSGKQVATLVREAAYRRLHDSDRINALIDQLLGDDLAARVIALDGLKQHAEPAAIALGMVLADESRSDEHQMIRQALVVFGPSADNPLVGMLDAPDKNFQARLFDVLARRRTMRAIIRMVAPAVALPKESNLGESARAGLLRVLGDIPTQMDAELFLHAQLNRYLAADLLIPHGPDGTITLWQWVEPGGVVEVKYSPRVARLILAAQAATDLYTVNRENEKYQLLYLRSILEASKVLNGMGQPLEGLDDDSQGPPTAGSIARQATDQMLLAVYLNAIKTDHVPAAVAAVEILAARGDMRMLASSSGRPSLLVDAIRHPDRRLRFAALQTIVKLDPKQPYPGSSYVAEALAFFANSQGKPRVLTGAGIASRSQSWGGMLTNIGFANDRAYSGKDLFRMAASNPDYEFILVGDTIDNPPVAQTVSLLRKDPRTAHLPVGIVTDVNEHGVGRRIVAQDDRAHVLIDPDSAESMILQIGPLLKMIGEQPVTVSERLLHAQFALETMYRFASNQEDYGFYDISRHQQMLIASLFQPQLSRSAAPVLGAIATPNAIRALVTLASQDTEELASRQVAVEALDKAIQKRGLLLNSGEVQRIYDLYNISLAVKDDEIVELLGSILDAIEGPYRRKQQANSGEDTP